MKKVVVNVPFIDRYTGKMHKADGKPIEMTEERVAEVKEVNPNFITVIGNVEKPDNAAEEKAKKEAEKKAKEKAEKKPE